MNERDQTKQPKYLRFWGKLREDLTFTPRSGWETTRVARWPDQSDPAMATTAAPRAGSDEGFRVELLTEKRTPIVSREPEIRPLGPCERTGNAPTTGQVEVYLPLHPEARVLVFRRGEFVIYERALPAEPPTIKIKSLNVEGERVHVAWQAEHDEAFALRFNVGVLLDQKRVFPLAMDIEKQEASLDLSKIPGAKAARIHVLATDGLRSAFDVSKAFMVAEKDLHLYIAQPGPNEVFAADQPVSYTGRALDIAGASQPAKQLAWRLDTEIVARGKYAGTLTDLQPGRHVLRLEWLADSKPRYVQEVRFKVAPRSQQQDRYRKLVERVL